jgi:hypothetical protein
MTSESDDLEHEVQHNLELRRELAAKVDKARGVSQRMGRGFHRLGLLIAASLFVIGLAFLASIRRIASPPSKSRTALTDIMNVWGSIFLTPQDLIMRATIGFVGLCWICLAVYGLVRAGWELGRFMAS